MTALFPQLLFDEIVEELKVEEGFRAHCYQDSTGNRTIGFGRCIEPGVGLGITESEAADLLKNDVMRSVSECRRWSWFDTISPARQGVRVELCFQLGYPKLSNFNLMLSALSRGDFDMAAAELMDSKFARQVPSRAERLAGKLRG